MIDRKRFCGDACRDRGLKRRQAGRTPNASRGTGRLWPTLVLGLVTGFSSPALSASLKADDTVLFLSGIGREEPDGWRLEIHGWIYESEYHKPLTSLFRRAIGIRDDDLTPLEQSTLRERAQFFLVDNERNKAVEIQLGGMKFNLSSSSPNGHFQTNIHLLREDIDRFGLDSMISNGVAQFQSISSKNNTRPAKGLIHIVPETGVSVISDIDDTIKISSVHDHKELLRNTFCRPFQAVPGMAALYQAWAKEGAKFHYLSASPWQLYVPLSQFIQTNGFPAGTFHLKLFRLKDHTALDLFKSPETFKRNGIEPFLREFPHRRFILVGDSGEKDPEIYGALARQFPKQISRIVIRDTTGEERDSARYQNAFSGIETNAWQIFRQPEELRATLD